MSPSDRATHPRTSGFLHSAFWAILTGAVAIGCLISVGAVGAQEPTPAEETEVEPPAEPTTEEPPADDADQEPSDSTDSDGSEGGEEPASEPGDVPIAVWIGAGVFIVAAIVLVVYRGSSSDSESNTAA